MASSIGVGFDPRKASGQWLKIDGSTPIEAVILCEVTEIFSCEQVTLWLDEGRSPMWPYTGPEDPLHDLKLEKRFAAYLPISVDGEQKIWRMPISAYKQIWELHDTVGSVRGMIIRIKKEGAGIKTKYLITQKAMSKKMPEPFEGDILEMLGPSDSDAVKQMLEDRFDMPYADVVKVHGPSKGSTTSPGKAKGKATSIDEEPADDFKDL
jgi:hypothetical protein